MASFLASTFVRTADPGWELTVVRNDAIPMGIAALAELGESELVAASLAGHPGAFDLIV